jgi:serine/threonine protein kinase
MNTIHVASALTTGLDPDFANVRTIAIDEPPIGQGGFGVVHKAVMVNGLATRPQAVKLLFDHAPGGASHGYQVIQELQRRLAAQAAKYRAGGRNLLDLHPALLAVPQFSFEGTLDGRPVKGYSANNLSAAGFESLGDVLDDDAKTLLMQSLPAPVRLRLARQLVDAFDLLSTQLHYIHADLKAEAVFVDLKHGRCALIDFDSGAAARDANDTPSTFGTKQDWLAPEIVQQLDRGGSTSRVIKVDLYSDMWSVNVGVHYLLLGCHPLFFLSEVSERSLRDYLKHFQWPDVRPSFKYFIPQYDAAYRAYRHALQLLPPDVVKRLAFTLNEGYWQPSRRTSYGQWKVVLASSNQPTIASFTADRTFVQDLRPVRLSWQVTGAAKLMLSGVGDVADRTYVDLPVRRDTTFTLTLVPDQGPPLARTIPVTVSQAPPVIRRFQTSNAFLTRATPARLAWHVSNAERIEIEPGIGNVSGRTHVDVLPKADTVYTLKATSAFGKLATQTIGIRVSSAPPSIRMFAADRTLLTDTPSVQLRWQVSSDAHEVRIDPIGRVAVTGAQDVPQFRDTDYQLTATSYFGATATARVRVTVSRQAPIIDWFRTNESLVRAGRDLKVSWSVRGASEVCITGLGIQPAAGTATVRPTGPVALVLEARSCFGATARATAQLQVLTTATVRPPADRQLRPEQLRAPYQRQYAAAVRQRSPVIPKRGSGP